LKKKTSLQARFSAGEARLGAHVQLGDENGAPIVSEQREGVVAGGSDRCLFAKTLFPLAWYRTLFEICRGLKKILTHFVSRGRLLFSETIELLQ
jgi:hypothetical protein